MKGGGGGGDCGGDGSGEDDVTQNACSLPYDRSHLILKAITALFFLMEARRPSYQQVEMQLSNSQMRFPFFFLSLLQ